MIVRNTIIGGEFVQHSVPCVVKKSQLERQILMDHGFAAHPSNHGLLPGSCGELVPTPEELPIALVCEGNHYRLGVM
jgi:hypothetical protein